MPLVVFHCTTEHFHFDKGRGALIADCSDLGLRPGNWPKEMCVYSLRTGRSVYFAVDHQAAIDNEGWDGEERHYCLAHAKDVADKTIRARKVILIND